MADAYKKSPRWVKRMEELFDQSDLNKDGCLSIEDFTTWSDNLEREVKPDPGLMEKARKATREFWISCGLKPGVKLTKEQFIDGMAEVSVTERAKHEEESDNSLYVDFIEGVFDAVDTNHNGFLELGEYEKMMRASNFDAGTAEIVFDMIDTNHNEKLSRKELRDYNAKFWFIQMINKQLACMVPSFPKICTSWFDSSQTVIKLKT